MCFASAGRTRSDYVSQGRHLLSLAHRICIGICIIPRLIVTVKKMSRKDGFLLNDSTPQQGFAEINGARLSYEVAGAGARATNGSENAGTQFPQAPAAVGAGQTVVLLHAGIADNHMWDDQFAAFAQRYRVIRYDQRGFGQSTIPAEPFAFHEDLHALLRHLGVAQAALVGCSMGGMTAIDMALAHPEMVTALVLVGSGLSGYDWPAPDSEEAALFPQMEAAEAAGDLAAASDLTERIWVAGPHRSPETVNPAVRERVRAMNLPNLARVDAFDQAQPQDLEPAASTRLAEIRAPTLVIVGDQDTSAIQAIANRLAAEIPGARKVVMPNTAHVPNMEQPEAFNQIVLDFLAAPHPPS